MVVWKKEVNMHLTRFLTDLDLRSYKYVLCTFVTQEQTDTESQVHSKKEIAKKTPSLRSLRLEVTPECFLINFANEAISVSCKETRS